MATDGWPEPCAPATRAAPEATPVTRPASTIERSRPHLIGVPSPAIHDHPPALHDPTNAVDHDADVREWIAIHRDDVREVAGRYGAELLFHSEQRGAVRRGRGERLRGRHSDLRVPQQLARVLAEHVEHRVRA